MNYVLSKTIGLNSTCQVFYHIYRQLKRSYFPSPMIWIKMSIKSIFFSKTFMKINFIAKIINFELLYSMLLIITARNKHKKGVLFWSGILYNISNGRWHLRCYLFMTTCVNKLTKTTENAPDSTQNNNKVSNADHKIPSLVSSTAKLQDQYVPVLV